MPPKHDWSNRGGASWKGEKSDQGFSSSGQGTGSTATTTGNAGMAQAGVLATSNFPRREDLQSLYSLKTMFACLAKPERLDWREVRKVKRLDDYERILEVYKARVLQGKLMVEEELRYLDLEEADKLGRESHETESVETAVVTHKEVLQKLMTQFEILLGRGKDLQKPLLQRVKDGAISGEGIVAAQEEILALIRSRHNDGNGKAPNRRVAWVEIPQACERMYQQLAEILDRPLGEHRGFRNQVNQKTGSGVSTKTGGASATALTYMDNTKDTSNVGRTGMTGGTHLTGEPLSLDYLFNSNKGIGTSAPSVSARDGSGATVEVSDQNKGSTAGG